MHLLMQEEGLQQLRQLLRLLPVAVLHPLQRLAIPLRRRWVSTAVQPSPTIPREWGGGGIVGPLGNRSCIKDLMCVLLLSVWGL